MLLIFSLASIMGKLFKTTHTEERSVHTNLEKIATFNSDSNKTIKLQMHDWDITNHSFDVSKTWFYAFDNFNLIKIEYLRQYWMHIKKDKQHFGNSRNSFSFCHVPGVMNGADSGIERTHAWSGLPLKFSTFQHNVRHDE